MSIASILSDLWRGGGLLKPPTPPPPQAQELQKSPGRIGLSFDSFARNPKIGVFDRVLARGHEMGERDEEEVARPGEKGNGEREREAELNRRPVLPFHDRAPKLDQKPRFSDYLAKESKALFCSLNLT